MQTQEKLELGSHGHRGSGHEDVGLAKVVSAARLMTALSRRNYPMIRFRNFLPLAAAALVGGATLALASPARAAFTITLHETGFADQTIPLTSGTINDTGNVNFGDYRVNISAFDSAPGISTLFGGALVSQNTFTVTTITPAGADLQITVQDDRFSSAPYVPGTAVTVTNSLSTTLISDGTVTARGFMTAGSTVTTTNISLTGPTFGGNVSNTASGSVAPLGSTFTLGNISNIHFNGGSGMANFTVTTLAPVPEPSMVLAALSGLPVGIGVWMRRRRQMA